MDRFGFKDVKVRSGEYHDGEPGIFIKVDYRLIQIPTDLDLWPMLRDARFPFVRFATSPSA